MFGYFLGRDRNPLIFRWILFLIAWLLVISSLFMPCYHGEAFFGSWEVDYPGFMKIAFDFIGLVLLPAAAKVRPFDETRYILTIVYFVSQFIANCYFVSTIVLVIVPPSLRLGWLPIGKIIRYPSIVLLLAWAGPVITVFHSLTTSKADRWDMGIYWMASGYTVMMLCMLYNPRIPNPSKAFPVLSITNSQQEQMKSPFTQI